MGDLNHLCAKIFNNNIRPTQIKNNHNTRKERMVKIAFWDNCLNERGTTTTLYHYAFFNKHLLGNESIIMYNTSRPDNRDDVIQRFKQEFRVIGVDTFKKVDSILLREKCNIFYITKAGENEGQISRFVKTVVHCVFHCNDPHGNVYSVISPFIKGVKRKTPIVPYMVSLPDHSRNMREKLNIPENAVVYGRFGGADSFDIPYVQKIVYNVAKENPALYFVFMNTNVFCEPLPNIIHISGTIDPEEKVEFINTCDAMIHARHIGESFGLAIAEFSSKNKPILTTPHLKHNPNVDRAHIHFLKEKGIWYNENNLHDVLTHFLTPENREEIAKQDWNAFRDYSPEKVMAQFKRVFID